MSKSVTMSFSAPVELSIQLEEYMETHGLNRSELIKLALISYLKVENSKIHTREIIESTYELTLEINKKLEQLIIK